MEAITTTENRYNSFKFCLKQHSHIKDKEILGCFVLLIHRIFDQEKVNVNINGKIITSHLNSNFTWREFLQRLTSDDPSNKTDSTPYFFGKRNVGILGIEHEINAITLYFDEMHFNYKTIERFACYLQNLVNVVSSDEKFRVQEVCFLSESEKDVLLNKWNETSKEFPEHSVLQQFFEKQCLSNPNKIAVKFCKEEITYSELNRKANKLAHYLQESGISRDVPVAVCVNRSTELVICLLAVLKAGGAYVPLDPGYPTDRLNYILKDCVAKVLISEKHIKSNLDFPQSLTTFDIDEFVNLDQYASSNPPIINKSSDLCYIIYTSGTTGKPKGVGNIHKALVNRILWMHEQYPINENDNILQKTPFSFDVSVWEFFWPLMVGATLVVAKPEIHKDVDELRKTIEKYKITTIHFVPSMLNLFLEDIKTNSCDSLRQVFVSGEALPTNLMHKFFEKFNCCKLHNLYGPTEAAIDVTYHECTKNFKFSGAIVPIGRPISNIKIYILDKFMNPTPIGVTGELHISGVGLARGYINREELTSEKFVPNPFDPGDKLYKTGDLCSYREDGIIEYLGRIDNQIKLRGLRIELGEIESQITEHSGIKKAVVVALDDEATNNKFLAAYCLHNSGTDLVNLEGEIKVNLKKQLPEFMVPQYFTFLNEFPLSPNGKLDVKKLPNPRKTLEIQNIQNDSKQESAETQKLKLIWQNLLGLKNINSKTSFFLYGGHSLLAMQLALHIRKNFNKNITLSEIFENPTIESQLGLLTKRREEIIETEVILTSDVKNLYEPFSLTDIQKAYLVGRTDAFSLGQIRSHIYVENNFDKIDVNRLEKAVNILLVRHGMLLAKITEDISQKTLKCEEYFKIKINHFTEQETRKQIINKFSQNDQWPLFDIQITRNHKGDVVHFYFDLLIIDGTGLEVFFNELSELYNDNNLKLKPLSLTYRDCIKALEKEKSSNKYQKAKSYWHDKIASIAEAPILPTRISQEDSSPGFVRRKGILSQKEWQSFQNKAAQIGITPAALLVTIYSKILNIWSKSSHFTMNLMFFNRPLEHEDVSNIVGNFSSTMLLNLDFSKEYSFAEDARKIQEQLLSDLEHNIFNGINVLSEINRRTGGSGVANVPVVFACALNLGKQNLSKTSSKFKWYGNGVSYNHLETPQVWFDHQVFEDHDGSFCYYWDVREEYFPENMIQDMFTMYNSKLLEVATSQELNIEFSTPSYQLDAIRRINSTEDKHIKAGLLYANILKQALLRSDKVAIITKNSTLTYAEIIANAFKIKNELLSYDVNTNDFVAIVMPKSWQQIVAALAVHMSGAAYIPVDAALPNDRIKQIIEISGCKTIITQQELDFSPDIPTIKFVDKFVENKQNFVLQDEINNFVCPQKAEDLAYAIFTSGSTGIPKGVLIDHQAAYNTVEAINNKYSVTSNDKAFAISSMSFDLSVYDIFGLLGVGGSIYIPTGDETKTPECWENIIRQEKITIWNSVPALMQLLVEGILNVHNSYDLRLVLLSGDWIPVQLPNKIRKYFNTRIISLGGATEASIWSNYYEIKDVDPSWSSIPYGKALPNQTMYILDDKLKPKPFNVPGMIYIGGKGLARGYLGDAEKTNASFIIHPTTNERLYKTGDIGKLCPNGEIEFLGRNDLQVKLQGYRIELEEIENILDKTQDIKQSVVRILGNSKSSQKLVAFYTANTDIDTDNLKSVLSEKLPFYMVPHIFHQLESFPFNINGKVDIKQLSKLVSDESNSSNDFVSPKTDLEKQIALIWSDLLDIKNISINDNFFELGGTSFQAFQMIYDMQKKLNISISLATLLQEGSISKLANSNKNSNSSLIKMQPNGNKKPIFVIHPSGGGVICYSELSKALGKDRPFFALQAKNYMQKNSQYVSIEDMASNYLELALKTIPSGDFILGGWSLGGVVAFEMARQLNKPNFEPIILIDSPTPYNSGEAINSEELLRWFIQDYGDNYYNIDQNSRDNLFQLFHHNINALRNYQPIKSNISLVQIRAKKIELNELKQHPNKDLLDWGWQKFSSRKMLIHQINATHNSIIEKPFVSEIAFIIDQIF